ncbi:homeobox protein MSX-2-like [Belonocnema kinseyi]|uniref:homeobox protein MSX-2-like n=1 Tax=Belonocnema kinseyi TaxID=2817044 RepID=UPI00143D690A|nr:homeobox protein MSX-2-like [Belonocnema kinseyi]
MSKQRVSQRSSSDFSIARILSNDLAPKPKSHFAVSEVKESVENVREDKLKEMSRLEAGSVNEDVASLKKDGERCDRLGKELPWLRCTRYSPPKLPRRPHSGKEVKRRLGSHPRIPFTKLQIQVLEEKYRISAYLSRRDVIQLAGDLNLPQNRIFRENVVATGLATLDALRDSVSRLSEDEAIGHRYCNVEHDVVENLIDTV